MSGAFSVLPANVYVSVVGKAKLANEVGVALVLEEINNLPDSKLDKLFSTLPLDNVATMLFTFMEVTWLMLNTLPVLALMVLSKLKWDVSEPICISSPGTIGIGGMVTCISGTFTSKPGNRLRIVFLQLVVAIVINATATVANNFFIEVGFG
jgi:hypothetical protein